ncbi:CaiB/BaiF CoA-transferase family protein [soil metagenome]
MAGPLHGVRVLELGGRGPVHFCGMLLADLGAEVISVQRPRSSDDITPLSDFGIGRGRRKVALDLRSPHGHGVAIDLVTRVDALIEGFVPGAAERLGMGPEDCLRVNERLVYGRMTAWGQDGPLAREPAHNLNSIAVSGALAHLGRADTVPAPPANLLADGGGAMFLAVGLLAALHEAGASGQGQVVDASMLEGAAYLTTMSHEMRNGGGWSEERGTNLNDSGAPFYDVYRTSDAKLVAVAAVEDPLWRRLMVILGIDETDPDRWDRAHWPWWHRRLQKELGQRTRTEWQSLAESAGGCVSPVLTLSEAGAHPHNHARGVFTAVHGAVLPSPTPRFSRTPLRPLHEAESSDQTETILEELGLPEA